MKKILCVLILAMFLFAGAALAEEKWEISFLFGSYSPSFSGHPYTRSIPDLHRSGVRGVALAYALAPGFKIHFQIDTFEIEKSGGRAPVGVKLKATEISVLFTLAMFDCEKFEIYGGIGLIDRRVITRWSGWGNLPYYTYDFAFPWGQVVLLGIERPIGKPFQAKVEVQHVTGDDGELYYIPLDWSGFKILVGIGIKL